jgi:hypothetical protein
MAIETVKRGRKRMDEIRKKWGEGERKGTDGRRLLNGRKG